MNFNLTKTPIWTRMESSIFTSSETFHFRYLALTNIYHIPNRIIAFQRRLQIPSSRDFFSSRENKFTLDEFIQGGQIICSLTSDLPSLLQSMLKSIICIICMHIISTNHRYSTFDPTLGIRGEAILFHHRSFHCY